MPPAAGLYASLIFSLDGNYIYYVRAPNNQTAGTAYRVPTLGGEPQKLAADVTANELTVSLAFSPDDKRMAFFRQDPGGVTTVVVAGTDGAGERKVASRRAPQFFNGLAWSPAGDLIALCVSNSSTGKSGVVTIPAGGGPEKPVGTEAWYAVWGVTWLPDSSGLLVTAEGSPGSPSQLWQLSYPGGEVRRITNDLETYSNVSLTADSHALVAVQSDLLSNLYVLPPGEKKRAQQITSGPGKQEGYGGLSWLGDDRIAYTSKAGGSPEVWAVNVDGSHATQLTRRSDFGTLFAARA